MKTNRFLLAAVLTALTFLACDSGGGGSGSSTCGGKQYDQSKYGCVNDELVGTCNGSYYNPEYERCNNGQVLDGAEITFPSSNSGAPSTSTEAYTIEEITSSYIRLKKNIYECTEEGLIEIGEYLNAYYSIDNKVLTFQIIHESHGSSIVIDTLIFNGTKYDEIIGIWTRNKTSGCYFPNFCNITRLAVTENTASITRDFCNTDRYSVGSRDGDFGDDGYTVASIKNCSEYTISNGTNTINITVSGNVFYSLTYNGKICEYKESSFRSASERTLACAKAINDCQGNNDYNCIEEAYYDYFEEIFSDCLENNNFPIKLTRDDYAPPDDEITDIVKD
jgi:hypothetical protein